MMSRSYDCFLDGSNMNSPYLHLLLCVLFFAPTSLSRSWDVQFDMGASMVFSKTSSHCILTNTYLKTSSKAFYVGLDTIKMLDGWVTDKWNFQLKSQVNGSLSFRCDEVFQNGYVFSVGGDNGKLHVDLFVSLYGNLLRAAKEARMAKMVVLMPSDQKEDWSTDVFMDDEKWWMQLLKIIAESYKILPLDSRLAAMQKTMCFKELMLEIPKINYTRDLVHNFVSVIKNHFNISQKSTPESNLLIISSSIHSPLIQEVQMIAPVEIVDVGETTFNEQVNFIQRATTFVGSTDTDLTLSLFLPPTSIFVRIIYPSTESSPSSDLLRKRGPYIEWRLQENKMHEFGEVIKKIQRHCKIN